jgi:ketosteroid isomerase-like protein
MFADNHHGDGRVAVWLPAPPGAQEALVETTPATFFRPPYVGGRGWVGISLDAINDEELRLYIETAWELVAPKRLRASRVSRNTVIEPHSNDPAAEHTLRIVRQFHEAFNRHDVDAIMALMTRDCVFENTFPPPDGARHVGQAKVRVCWEQLFRDSPAAHFAVEELFASGPRAVLRWRYTWSSEADAHVRGVDIYEVRDGLVAEKLSYVKG